MQQPLVSRKNVTRCEYRKIAIDKAGSIKVWPSARFADVKEG
jgi:hypothetical protein